MEQTLGKRIMAARKGMGLTQDQLAERLGVTAQAVSKWENDQSCPDITMLPKLAELFGITTDELLGISAPQPAHEAEVVHTGTAEECNQTSIPWNRGRKGAIALAALVLLVGGMMLGNVLLGWGASFWDILWPSALLVFGWSGGFSFFRLGCGFFDCCFLAVIITGYDLSGELALPIILLVVGLCLLCDALFRPKRFRWNHKCSHDGHHPPEQNSFRMEQEGFQFSGSFGQQAQTVDLAKLAWGDIRVSFGEYSVELSGVESLSDPCSISANCSFGQLTLLVPRRFRVECDSRTAFASVDIHGQPDSEPQGSILLRTSVSFGEIKICYI